MKKLSACSCVMETPIYACMKDNSVKKEYLILLFYNKQNINKENREVISDSWS